MQKQILAYLKQSKQEELQNDAEAMAQIKKQFLEEQQQLKISKMHQQQMLHHQQLVHLRDKDESRHMFKKR